MFILVSFVEVESIFFYFFVEGDKFFIVDIWMVVFCMMSCFEIEYVLNESILYEGMFGNDFLIFYVVVSLLVFGMLLV